MTVDLYIAEKEKILSTHNWGEAYYRWSRYGGQKHVRHSFQICQDCHEYKSYNRSALKPCAGKPEY